VPVIVINQHLTSLAVALRAVDAHAPRLQSWAGTTAAVLLAGGRLLACGTGASAAQAEHLVSRLAAPDDERPALPAFAVAVPAPHGDRQPNYAAALADRVRELGRRGDILLCICATGDSDETVACDEITACARAAADLGMTTWALTGPGPNQLADACAEAIAVPAPAASTAEEVHLAAIHIFCAAVDSRVRDASRAPAVASRVSPPPEPRAVMQPNPAT
jgi:D-sedoheptulose 7-phosphate isomerase